MEQKLHRCMRTTPFAERQRRDHQAVIDIVNKWQKEGFSLLAIYELKLPPYLQERWTTYSGFWRALKKMQATEELTNDGVDKTA